MIDIVNFDERYKTLNAAQQSAVDHIEGPLMVLAGPGTGKTELLGMRVANILKRTDTLPQNILCLTFSEAGADAMRGRLIDIIGPAGYQVAVHTFHGFAADVASRYRHYFHQGAELRIADNLQRHQIIASILSGLSYDNPLKLSFNGEFTSISDIQTAISEIKRSGLTEEELRSVLEADEIAVSVAERELRAAFTGGRITAAQLEPLGASLTAIAATNEPRPRHNIPRLSTVIAHSLEEAIEEARVHPRTTPPLTAWKNAWCGKDSQGELVLKSRGRIERLLALLPIYTVYQQTLLETGLQDFDDLISELIYVMETQHELRYELQEQYLYLMVDEFQDTNLAQMRILDNLTNNPILEGNPNLMVVGDDDQAIFSFQGADVGNILTFSERFADKAPIVLTENYRSPAIVLEAARAVITQGTERLEARIPDLTKSLSANAAPASPQAILHDFISCSDERNWIVESIAAQLSDGHRASGVAVIAKNHADLESLLPHFRMAGISVSYEKHENVLENESVHQLILLARLVSALGEGNLDETSIILPELLAHPAWNVSSQVLWELSLKSFADKRLWLELLPEYDATRPFQEWLQQTAQLARQLPLELLLDRLVGHNQPEGEYHSPLKGYFFADTSSETDAQAYLEHLESLRAIREKLREHFADESSIGLSEFIHFIDLHRATGTKITRIRMVGDQQTAVNLLTAHGSKGLEFDSVYVINAIDSRWGAKARGRSPIISYPENLRLRQHDNSTDERLRLFFVAMTRAKRSLHITYAHNSDTGKSQLLSDFLSTDQLLERQSHEDGKNTYQVLEAQEMLWYERLVTAPSQSLQQALGPRLESYKLSATDFCAFLDVTKGGPRGFLLNNLLRFPSAMPPAASYGSAIHTVLQRAHAQIARHEQPIPEEDLLQIFENELATYPLSREEFDHYLTKGSDSLRLFLNDKYDDFTPSQLTELNFASQQVVIGEARLKGKLDLVDIDKGNSSIIITDYKTGSAFSDWGKGGVYDKIKAHHYAQQLLFYQLLVANSRDYRKFTVTDSVIQFVEPDKSGVIRALSLPSSTDDLERTIELVGAVWRRIKACDFPETSHYDQSIAGIKAFEQDLLDEKI